jgi:AcrR family transcriptional regulator
MDFHATDQQGAGDREPGPARRRTRMTAAQRRETILRAATEVFAEAGYRAAKVSDVAERVGVTEPVIFQNFGSKGALFAAVIERAAHDIRESLREVAAGSGSAAALLAHVLAGSAHGPAGMADGRSAGRAPGQPALAPRHAPQPGAAYGVLFADAAALASDPALSEPGHAAIRAVAGHLADLVRRAQAEGSVRAGADPEAAAWLLLSVLSARRLRGAAMPDSLEPAVTALALGALTPP